VPYKATGPLSAKLLKNGTLKAYKDYPHGMINGDFFTKLVYAGV